jgi:PTH1 family peptidyl-tRNA hydrolase
LDYFAKKNNFHFKPSNWVPLQNTNLKEEPFPFKTEYLHELIWESGTILDKENISLENIFVITDDLNLSFGTIRTSGLKEAMEATTD